MKLLFGVVGILFITSPTVQAQGLHRGPDGKFSMSLCIKNNSASGQWSKEQVQQRCNQIRDQWAATKRAKQQKP
jgi:hypothetical protein